MQFTLCYKKYDYKMSLKAMREFEEATGKCLWSTLISYIYRWTSSRSNGDNLMLTLSSIGEVLTFSESAKLLHCLAKQENKLITIDEIEDAMFHVGLTPVDQADEQCQPYQLVIFQVAIDIHEYLKNLSELKKSQANC